MSKGWDAVGAVGLSLLAQGQRDRALEKELKLKAKYDQELFDRKAAAEKVLMDARVKTEEARQAAALAAAARSEFDIRAGKAVGNQRIFGVPGEAGVLAEPIGVSETAKYVQGQQNARTAATNKSRERAAATRRSGTSTARSADYTKDIIKAKAQLAELKVTPKSAYYGSGVSSADAEAIRAAKISAKEAEIADLESAQKARTQPAGLLQAGERVTYTGPENDVDAIVAKVASGELPASALPPGINVNVTTPSGKPVTQTVGGGDKARGNVGGASYAEVYAAAYAEFKSIPGMTDEKAKQEAEAIAAPFKATSK